MNVDSIEKLVTDMHRFFTEWFSGSMTQDANEFTKFTDLMDPSFTLINPDASVSNHAAVVNQMKNYYAKFPGFEAETRNFELIAADDNLVVATYDELQRYPAGGNSRRSTVLFVADADSAYGYRWRHAQETWLDAGSAEHK